MNIRPLVFAAIAASMMPVAALADDPNDPTMRSAAARAHDRETIRQMNLEQLAKVRKRDAGYAEGWSGWRRTGGNRTDANGAYAERSRDYEHSMADYARERARYERQMSAWRRAVAACRDGEYDAC